MNQFENWDMARPGAQTHLQATLLLAAAKEALLLNKLLKDTPRMVPRDVQESMLLHYSRFITLFDRAGGTLTPKCHIMYHAISMIDVYGNPKYFATYVDESFNGVIAAVARSCHRLTWTDSIFRKLGAIQELDARSLAGFRH